MKSINFSTGVKEYAINGNPENIIRVNVADLNLPKRIKDVQIFFDEISQKYKGLDRNVTTDELFELDKQMRDKINYALGTDVCTPAFGEINCMTPVSNGEMLFESFFNAFKPIIEADMKAAAQAQAVHIEDKTNKYISVAQSAPVAPQISVTANPMPDISNLTQEQKDAMLIEMMRQGK